MADEDDRKKTPAEAGPSGIGEVGESAKKKRKRNRANKELSDKVKAFSRGVRTSHKQIQDKKLKGKVKLAERLVGDATQTAAKANVWLLPEEAGSLEAEGLEHTWNFKQQDIVEAVEVGAAQKAIDLSLKDLGPYTVDFSSSGRHMLFGGEKGHLAVLDWQKCHIVCEEQVRETIRDVKFLHNEQFFATAQRKYVYIYDKRGLEVHCIKDMAQPWKLDFLPHHFLLTSIGENGILMYQDTSTGQQVCAHKSRLGPCNVMRHNPWNAVMCLGHSNGTVTMWTPNISTPVVKLLSHRGPVRALAVDKTGHHLVTSGADSQVKVWDIRMLKPLHSYFSSAPCEYLDISQRGLLAVGFGRRVQIWKDALTEKAKAPYLNHTFHGGTLADVSFCPYEDVLCGGHSGGVSTILVPGAGEPNFDSFVANPYQTKKQRREAEVAHLLDKLQPDTIVLNPETIGTVQRTPVEVQKQRQAEAREAARLVKRQQISNADGKTRMKGKNKPSRKFRKKQQNIVDEKKLAMEERKRELAAQAKKGGGANASAAAGGSVPSILKGFYKGK
mmetsp:Transcript_8489/g.24334  ORF Transcript_8489/g.24334 Transcript_8489/m.24334 type:complete len:556 (-) Transcript_8489:100-1767(-)